MRHDVNDHATEETRRKGALAAAEAKRAKRDAARELAIERLAGMTDKALARLEALLVADGDADALRAVKEVLDRVLGRPTQAVEVSGNDGEPIEIEYRGVKLADVIDVAREAGMELGSRDR